MKVNKELIKGSTSILILSLLKDSPMYGYQMIKEIEKRSDGVFSFKEGTLYPILHSLEAEGLIKSFWEENESKRKRKFYQIEKKGTKMLAEKKEEWTIFKSAIDKVVLEVVL